MVQGDSVLTAALMALGAFFSTLVIVRLYISITPKIGAIAGPTARGSHKRPIPTGAGISILIVVAFFMAVFFVILGTGSTIHLFLLSASLITALGFVDDLRPLPLLFRLFLQIAAVVPFIIAFGPYSLSTYQVEPLSTIATVVLIVAFINIFNFMDGSDGMVAVHGVLVFVGWSILGFFNLNSSITTLALSFAGALAGFLVFNWHPAKVFLGDAGSTLIGFSVAAIPLITESGFENASRIPFWPIVFFSWIFVFDAFYTRAKRFIAGSRFWEPNRDHFYQRLIDSGVSQGSVAMLYGAITALMVLVTLGTAVFGGVFAIFLAVGTIGLPILLVIITFKKGIDLNI